MGFNAVSCAVRAVSLVILGSRAVEGSPSYSYPVLSSIIRLDCLEELFLLSLISFRRVSTVKGFNAVFYTVWAIFLMSLELQAVEGASFSSRLVIDTDIRLNSRKIMLINRPCSIIPLKIEKKVAKTANSWHANRGQHFTRGWDSLRGLAYPALSYSYIYKEKLYIIVKEIFYYN
jgi:hypothetical protein